MHYKYLSFLSNGLTVCILNGCFVNLRQSYVIYFSKLVLGKPRFAIIATYFAQINLNSKHLKIYQFGKKKSLVCKTFNKKSHSRLEWGSNLHKSITGNLRTFIYN